MPALRTRHLVTAAAATLLASIATTGSLSAAELSEARLRAAATDTANWLTHGRDLAGQRFSPLKEITPENVKRLTPAFIYQAGTSAPDLAL